MYANHQTTKRIVNAIMLAARQRKEHDERLIQLLREVKRGEYHAGTHSFNFFFFFTRSEAAKWEGVDIPFRRQKIRLTGVNHAQTVAEKKGEKKDAWGRQLGTDGAKNSEQKFRYKVHLLNVTSFLDIDHLLTLLKAKLAREDITAYSIDTPGPQSEHSQHWNSNLARANVQLDFTRCTGSSG